MAEAVNLQEKYNKEIRNKLAEDLGNLNVHSAPKIEKVVLNSGVGSIANARRGRSTGQQTEAEMLEDIIEGIALISGQKPRLVRARKSIATFKLRAGMVVGLQATLRNKKMYDFLARLIHVALPRTRDFRGIKLGSVDQHGNLTIGIKESNIFPELPPANTSWGMEITLVTNTEDREQAIELFKRLGLPLQKEEE